MLQRFLAVVLTGMCLAAGCHKLGHSTYEPSGRPDERVLMRSVETGPGKERPGALTSKGKEIERSLGIGE